VPKHKPDAPSTSSSLARSLEWTMRAANNAIASATRVYEISPNSYTFEALQDAMTVRDLLLELERKAAELAP
jgi:hypothetical protein